MSEVDDILAYEVERFIPSIQESATPSETLAEEVDRLHRQRTSCGLTDDDAGESDDEEVQGIIDDSMLSQHRVDPTAFYPMPPERALWPRAVVVVTLGRKP